METVNDLQLALCAAAAAILVSLVVTTDERKTKTTQHVNCPIMLCDN